MEWDRAGAISAAIARKRWRRTGSRRAIAAGGGGAWTWFAPPLLQCSVTTAPRCFKLDLFRLGGFHGLCRRAHRPRNHCPLGRPPGAAHLAAPSHLHAAVRARGALAPAGALLDYAAALRPDGAARAARGGPEDERALAPPHGHRRQ